VSSTDPHDLPIESGKAQITVFAAMADLTAAVLMIERVSMACPRALDVTATPRTGEPAAPPPRVRRVRRWRLKGPRP
jgi:hypothetical protein